MLLTAALFLSPTLTQLPSSGQLAPRRPLPAREVRALELPADAPAHLEHRLIVKFVDGAGARLDGDGVLAAEGSVELIGAAELAAREGLQFEPLIRLEASRVESLLARAAARSGRAQPDLFGMYSVQVPSADPAALERIGSALQALPEVEFAWIQLLGEAPPGDILPPTPLLAANQTYAQPNPGLDFIFAQSIGADGAGVRISDCEYGWKAGHEDLVDVNLNLEPGQTPVSSVASLGWDDHGTAVMGEMTAADNGYGCTGLVTGATFATYPEWTNEGGSRRVECIASAIADSEAGDIVLLEMQTSGSGSFAYVPAEYDPAVFAVVKVGTDAGVVVIAAAGNGNQDLDGPSYAGYRAMGDSGAILVGAGSASSAHDKLSFSTYGSRVNVQAWGESVFTLGYGSFAAYGGDSNQEYTATFNGTSSASPLVTSAAAALQGQAIADLGAPLTPLQMRELLVSTGVPQGGGGHIGPFPDMQASLGLLLSDPSVSLGGGLAGSTGVPNFSLTGLAWPATSVGVRVSGAEAGAAMVQVIGQAQIDLPLLGGVLVPSTELVSTGIFAGPGGDFSTSLSLPAGLAPGLEFFVQYWMTDGGGPQGFAATDGRKLTIQ
ncbi:S8 family serine peptidase [Engelhardtia mirabilis]|uniref:Subtilisin DY n=1 Tax=Engelhardtia mirabilis TaxID=2528011 RepID=A0A518BQW4_9BACT|nr:Subtilisin DY [Planctomycetes bacterium Pla133]QDV03695.1 Subtilisin DY [Planctomycetes bacterium Pla86]